MHFTGVKVSLLPGHVCLIAAVTRCKGFWDESGCKLELTQECCECISVMLSWSK